MKLKCPKCGKVTEVSAVELRKQRGNVVCPRCLAVFKEPVPADAGDDDEALTPPPVPSPRRAAASAPSRRRPISFVTPPEPAALSPASPLAPAKGSHSAPAPPPLAHDTPVLLGVPGLLGAGHDRLFPALYFRGQIIRS